MAIKTDMKGISKRNNSYTFTVSCGFDGNGKHIRHYMTYRPPEGISGERADRMAQREYEIFFNKCHIHMSKSICKHINCINTICK